MLVAGVGIVPSFIAHNLWLLVVLVCVGNLSLTTAQDTAYIQWDPPVQISFDPYISVLPRIAAVDNDVYLMWIGANTPYSFFARSTDYGERWTAPVFLTDTTRFFPSSTFGVSSDHVYFLTTYRPPPYIEYLWMRTSLDRGNNWPAGRILFEGIDNRSVVAYAENTVVNYELDSLPSLIHFAHSRDWGKTWTQFAPTMPPGRAPNGVALVDSTLHQVREVGSLAYPEVAYGQSRDFGATWRPEIIISQNDLLVSDEMHVAADSAGNVYAVWRDERGGCIGGLDCAVMFRKSTDFGATWDVEREISDAASKGGVPRIASDRNVVVACWYTSASPSKVRCRVSFDYGETWGRIYTVSPSNIASRDEDVAITGGNLHICWFQEDNPPISSEIFYRRGRIMTTGVGEQTNEVPNRLRLLQNYPNPFNGTTVIEYHLPAKAEVTLKVYNVLGQEVALLVAESKPAGVYRIQFDASTLSRPLASGVYCYRLSVHDGRGQMYVQSRRMLYLK